MRRQRTVRLGTSRQREKWIPLLYVPDVILAARRADFVHQWATLQNLCTACQKPLFPIYNLAAVGRVLTREAFTTREKSLWRYRELLPLPLNVKNQFHLG